MRLVKILQSLDPSAPEMENRTLIKTSVMNVISVALNYILLEENKLALSETLQNQAV